MNLVCAEAFRRLMILRRRLTSRRQARYGIAFSLELLVRVRALDATSLGTILHKPGGGAMLELSRWDTRLDHDVGGHLRVRIRRHRLRRHEDRAGEGLHSNSENANGRIQNASDCRSYEITDTH